MSGPSRRVWTCARCLQSQKVRGTSAPAIVHSSKFLRRSFSIIPPLQDEDPTSPNTGKNRNDPNDDNKEQGAMSRRLADMAEETMDSGSKSDQKLMKEVFSDELKKQLEERIAQTSFSAQNQRAASQVNMPVRWKHPSAVTFATSDISNTLITRHRTLPAKEHATLPEQNHGQAPSLYTTQR